MVEQIDVMKLHQSWVKNVQRLFTNKNACEKQWTCFLELYAEPQRYYHNLFHMGLLCDQVDSTVEDLGKTSTKEETAQFSKLFNLTLWFHDAIYDPTKKDNEVQSQVLFTDWSKEIEEITEEDRQIVELVILDTISHKKDSGKAHLKEEVKLSEVGRAMYEKVSDYFLDADLSILGEDRDVYLDYADKIRKEYQHIPDDVYNVERPKVL